MTTPNMSTVVLPVVRTVISVNFSTEAVVTTMKATETPDTGGGSHVLAYVLVPLGSLVLVAFLAIVVMMICRKTKLERLRHHLMPMYNFDPQEEEEWETELLDDRGRRIIFHDGSPSPTSPKLKFST